MNKTMCPSFEAGIDIISQKWVALIVYYLLNEPKRFKDLEAEVGISASMLSERLKSLEKEDVVVRNVYPETPVRIEYSLTDKGRALAPVFELLMNWSQEHM